MGNGLQYFLNNRLSGSISCIKKFTNWRNNNYPLRFIGNASSSYTFFEISPSDLSYIKDGAKIFNHQLYGVSVKDFMRETKIKKRFTVVATVKSTD